MNCLGLLTRLTTPQSATLLHSLSYTGTDPMIDARSGSGNTMGSLGIITIGGAVGLVAVFFVVQCYRGWQRWSKARQSGG